MWLTRFAIARRVTIAMIVGILIVLGLVGLGRMPWDLFPSLEIPVVVVTVPYPGAGPDEIEQRIVKPLEDSLSVIEGVDYIDSRAQENLGAVIVNFLNGVDVDVAAADVRDALGQVSSIFPEDAQEPMVTKFDPSSQPIIIVGITGNRAPRDLRKLVDDEVKPALGRVRGVAAVQVSGGQQREIQILAPEERLIAVGLTADRLSQLLAAENIDLPSGTFQAGSRDFRVRMLGQIKDLDELRGLPIDTPRAGLMRLDQIATVEDTVVEPTEYTRINGTQSVAVQVMKQSVANTVTVARGVRDQVEDLRGRLPGDIAFTITEDRSEGIIEAILDLRNAIAYGAIFAALVVFLFLHNGRGTIIVAIAIPTSLIASFLPVGLGFGFTLNMMVMLGLALSVGVLVDDSVVVLENIQRHLDRGELPTQAALNGRSEIGAAAIAITLVDVVVYLPIALMRGIIGQVFYSFAVTVVVCVLFSLMMAFTLTPMLSAWWYERETRSHGEPRGLARLAARLFDAWDNMYGQLVDIYRGLLERAVAHPYVTLGIAFIILIAVFGALGRKLPNEFFPATDERQVSITVEMPVGTRLEVTDETVRAIEARLADREKYPEIAEVFAQSGAGGSTFMGLGKAGPNYGYLSLFLRPARERKLGGLRSDRELAQSLRGDLADLPSARLLLSTVGGPGGGEGMQLVLSGEDYQGLLAEAERLRGRISAIEGIRDVELSTEAGRPEVQVEIDRQRARDRDLSAGEVAMALRRAIAGGTDSKYRVGGDEYDIRVKVPRADASSIEQIEGLMIGKTDSDEPIFVRDVATITTGSGPTIIERYQRERSVTITSQTPGIATGDAKTKIEAILSEGEPFNWTWSGSTKWQAESMAEMVRAIMLAIILIYMVTAALYNSVLEPLNILLIIPLALVGAIVGLYVTGMSMSLVAMIGMIMLMGIVGKNSILVVDYTNTLRARGRARTEALIEAGTTRMHPVLMTTLAASLGMVPTALALAEGSEWRAPMAVVVIFGLILATPVSLVVVPASYVIWDQVGRFFHRIGLRVFVRGRHPEDTTAPQPPEESDRLER